MTKEQFIQEWKQFGKELINEEQPKNSLTDEHWEMFGKTMFKVKTKLEPNEPLENLIPVGTECRQFPRAFVELNTPFNLAQHCGMLYENWAE